MNLQTKIRISILLCFTLLFYSFQPIRSVGAASIGEPVPTDVSYWGFDENTTSSILNQGYNNILCLWDFENHEYLLVKCPDHMYYVPGGEIFIDGDYTSLFSKKDYQDYLRDQIVYSWGVNKGYFNLTASQYFTVYHFPVNGELVYYETTTLNGIVNASAWNSSKTKYNALRWLYDHDSDTYNECNYALCWATDSIEYAYTGSGVPGVDLYNWASGTFFSGFSNTKISFTGGSTLNAAASDIPVYVFYPGGFNFSSPVVATPTPSPVPTIALPDDMPDINNLSLMCKAVCNYGSNFFDGYINPREYVFVYTDFLNNNVAPQAYIWRAPDGNAFGNIFGVGTDSNYIGKMYFYKFNNDTQELTFLGSIGSSFGYNDGGSVFNAGLSFVEAGWNGRTVLNTCNSDFSRLGTTRNFAQKPYFFVYWTNSDIISGEEPGVSPTPSPTSSPTPTPYTPIYVSPTSSPVPSPGVTITPTQGPTETSVKELHGWKKALRDILQSVFVGNTEAIEGYFKDAVGGYQIVQNPFKQIVDSIYIDGSDQENFNPFENQQVDFIFDVHDQNGNIVGGEHTTNWKLTILPKTFWEWLKSYSNYFEIVFYMVDASFLGATMKRWLTKQNDEGSETKEGGSG